MRFPFVGSNAVAAGHLTKSQLRHRYRPIKEDYGQDIVEQARAALLSRGWQGKVTARAERS